MSDGPVVVFAGPSLHGADAAQQAILARAVLRPPAARGDVLRALALAPRAVVLVDGYFHRVPAVTHQELLYALDAGVPVYGAASMGALRAAELGPFGMRGVGWVYEAFAAGELDGDDEVALLHAPEEYGYAPVGLALAEVRLAVARAVAAGRIPPAAAAAGLAALKRRSFEDRTASALAEVGLPADLFHDIGRAGVKRADAVAAVALACEARIDEGPGAPALSGAERPPTGYLRCFKELYLPVPGAASDPPPLLHALHVFLVLHPRAEAFVRAVRTRACRAAAAEAMGASPAASDVAQRAAALRSLHQADRGGRASVLPEPEYLAEARLALLAEHAAAEPGMAILARRFGGGRADLAAPWRWFEEEPDLLPAWDLARRFACTPALAPAARAARAAAEVLACWRRAHEDARIEVRALYELAAGLWGVALADVTAAGVRRGLFTAAGLAHGLREALELLAPAERLPRPINDYPAARAALLAAGVDETPGV